MSSMLVSTVICQDVLMQEAKLYLIFEFLTMDLKKYMDTNVPKDGQMDPKLVKSYTYQLLQVGCFPYNAVLRS
jgi:hypothetical protein